MKHLIEITLILLMIAFVVGCKDKIDSNEMQLIYTDESIYDEPEPNEPIQEICKFFEQVLDQEDRLIDLVRICIERIEQLEKKEPNEPAMRYSLPFPTWPEYIEIPKNLVIEYEYYTGFEESIGPSDDGFSIKTKKVMGTTEYYFPKGTKIYFKEDED